MAGSDGIEYRVGAAVSAAQFAKVLRHSTLGARRPVDDEGRLERMLANANLVVTAWDGEELIGIARSMSDFAYVTYCSDLCVAESHQRQGVGKELLRKTLEAAPYRIVLLAAPAAVDYYPRIGFAQHPSAWTIEPGGLD